MASIPVATLIAQEALRQGVDPQLALGIGKRESGFNQGARSPAGAIGVMQLMPGTAKELGVNPHDLNENIRGGVAYIKKMLDQFGGDPTKAVAAYNAGPNAVLKYGGVPPYKETQAYVPAVLNYAGQQQAQPQSQSMDVTQLIQQAMQQQTQSPQISVDPQSLIGPAPNVPGKGMQTLLTVLGALGQLGGLTASGIGAFKGVPNAGNAALASSGSLLEQLAKYKTAENEYAQKQAIAAGNDPNVASAILLGGKDEVAKQLLGGGSKTTTAAQRLDLIRKGQEIYDNSPEGVAAKTKADLEAAVAKEKALAGIKGAKDPLSDIRVRTATDKVFQEIGPAAGLSNDLRILDETLGKMETGPLAGRATKLEAAFTGDPQYARAQAALGRLLSNFSRTVAGERGVLTDQDIERVRKAVSNENMTPAARRLVVQDALSSLRNRIGFSKKRANFLAGQDVGPLVDDWIASTYGEPSVPAAAPAEASQPSGLSLPPGFVLGPDGKIHQSK